MTGYGLVRMGVFALALFAVGAAQAQDALTAGPTVYKKVLENDRIRVLEANFRPGAKVGSHSHPEHVLYMLTAGTLVLKPAGRTAYEMSFTPGEALFLPAQTRAVENGGDKAVRALIVELKSPARSVRRGPSAKRSSRGRPRRGRRR